MAKKTIAITSEKFEPHTDVIIEWLERLGARCLRLNLDDMDKTWMLSIDPCTDNSTIRVTDSGLCVRFEDIGVVYVRSSVPPRRDPAGLPYVYSVEQFLDKEYRGLIDVFWQLLKNKCYNHPYVMKMGDHKVYQLSIAGGLGLAVPATLVTNDYVIAREFVDRHGPCVIKSLAGSFARVGDEYYQCLTRPVSLADIDACKDSFGGSPVIFQVRITKRRDIRVTIIDDSVFACAIDSQAHSGAVEDWRCISPDVLKHEMISLPREVERSLLLMQEKLNTPFGAVDLVEDQNGQFWFLENNLNGSWYWIELKTGAGIARRLAESLIERCDRSE